MPGLKKAYEVNYYQVDQNKATTPVSILHFMQDIAISHTEEVGLSMDRLLKEGTGWFLNRWLLRLDRYPALGEQIIIETWPSKFEHFYARREFRIEDAQGNPLGCATSLWIYLNVHKKRPVRIPEDFNQVYSVTEETVIEEPFASLPTVTHVDNRVVFHVRRSDIDAYGHVNNTCYVEWMLEGIPENMIRDYQLSELEVIYKREISYGTDIYSECQLTNAHPTCLHRILESTSGQTLALGRTVWKKR